jgi:hypothetical protein
MASSVACAAVVRPMVALSQRKSARRCRATPIARAAATAVSDEAEPPATAAPVTPCPPLGDNLTILTAAVERAGEARGPVLMQA